MSVTGAIPAQDRMSVLDQGLWQAFATARGDRAFAASWLTLMMKRLPQVGTGVVMETAGGRNFVPVAVLPDPRRDLADFREVAERAVATGRPVTRADDGLTRVAVPVRAQPDGAVEGIVALELREADPRAVQAALREVHWASGWLSARHWQRRAEEDGARAARAAIALDLLAAVSEHPRPEAAAMAAVNELQAVAGCDRVSIGLLEGRATAPRIRLLALSHSAWFRRKSDLAASLEAAMEESFDQQAAVGWPALPGAAHPVAVAQEAHVKAGRASHLMTVPMADAEGPVGAIAFERRGDRPFAEADLRLAEGVAALLAPALEQKRRARRWFGGRIVDAGVKAAGVILGPRRLSWKLLAVVIVAVAVAAATVRIPFRLAADATLLGEVQRAAVAPFAGYIDAGGLRAGDAVAEGQEIARLDDADLRLEELRWRSEIDRLASQQRNALAEHDRAQVTLLEAQLAQARAQLHLAEAQRARTLIRAPITGTIVSGDLSQRLGAPVQAGEVLFEIAPLDSFRLDIHLDERDLRHVAVGQAGRIVLTGQPDAGLPFTVTRLTPQAEVREGANTFRIEARLAAAPAGLLPGMEGVAKIDAGRDLAVVVWSRGLVHWLRAQLWMWQP